MERLNDSGFNRAPFFTWFESPDERRREDRVPAMSLRLNVVANFLSLGYLALVGIVMVPAYVSRLGVEAFGLVSFFVVLQTFFLLLDFGLTPSMSREVARFRGGAVDALSLRQLLRGFELVFGVIAIVGACGLGLALTTTRRNEVFRTVPSFWQDVLATRPRAVRARINLGKYLNERGSSAEASVLLEEAVRLRPDDPQTHYGLGVTLAAQGRLDEAITHYREALRLRPRDASAYNNLGNALARQGHFDDAVVQYREAIALDPAHARAHRNLGHALALSGHLKEAIWYYDESLRLHPEAETHVDLAGVLVRAGDIAAARQHLEQALALEPRFEPARRALDGLPAQDE